MKPGAALLAFHLRVGVRLAMRVLSPALAVVFAAFYILRPEFMVLFFRNLISDGSFWETGLLLFGLLRLAAGVAAPRVAAGRLGWVRHLPLPKAARPRLEAAAVFAAISPVLAVLAVFAVPAAAVSPSRSAAAAAAGLALGAWAAAASAVPDRTAAARLLMTAGGVVAAAAGQPVFAAAGAALLAFGESLAGPVEPRRTAAAGRRFHELRRGAGIQAAILLRALRWRPAAALLLALPPLGAAWLFIHNNDFPPALRQSAWRLGAALGLIVFLAGMAAATAVRRPAWPWLRSLPQGSSARVIGDALVFLASALPFVAAVACLSAEAAGLAAALAPLAALRAAAAVRSGPDTRFGPAGRLITEGVFAATLLALSPWTTLLFPALLPAAYLDARSEERALKATRWTALHHRQSGDPLSWSRA